MPRARAPSAANAGFLQVSHWWSEEASHFGIVLDGCYIPVSIFTNSSVYFQPCHSHSPRASVPPAATASQGVTAQPEGKEGTTLSSLSHQASLGPSHGMKTQARVTGRTVLTIVPCPRCCARGLCVCVSADTRPSRFPSLWSAGGVREGASSGFAVLGCASWITPSSGASVPQVCF